MENPRAQFCCNMAQLIFTSVLGTEICHKDSIREIRWMCYSSLHFCEPHHCHVKPRYLVL